jgi:WD40 repeat protein
MSIHTDVVRAVAFAPDGTGFLASGGWDREVHLWCPPHYRDRVDLTNEGAGGVWSLAFATDGWSLAIGRGDGEAVIFWLGGKRRRRQTVMTPLKGHDWPVNAVAFAPDCLTLVTGSHDRTVKIWDARWGREQATLVGHKDWVRTLAFSADGRTLASGGDEAVIKLWDMPAGRERASLHGHEGPIRHLAFAPDGRTLMSGSWDATVRLWDAATGRAVAALDWKIGRVHCLAIAPDGMTAAAGADQSILVWDLDPLD